MGKIQTSPFILKERPFFPEVALRHKNVPPHAAAPRDLSLTKSLSVSVCL